MVGENFENYLSEVTKMYLKSSTMAREHFESYLSEMTKMHLKSSTMVGRKFLKNYISEMAKMHLKSSTMEKILKTSHFQGSLSFFLIFPCFQGP